MRYIAVLLFAIPVTGCAAFSYEPAGEQEFQQIASGGCRNRDGDFIIRSLVSNADEDTVVLFDPEDSRSTISLSLPGRGPLQRTKGVFGKNKQVRSHRCKAQRASTIAHASRRDFEMSGLSYRSVDGSSQSISY